MSVKALVEIELTNLTCMFIMNDMNKAHEGYYIYGSYQTVAWYKTKQEADAMCRKMNYGMEFGYYKVIPSYNKTTANKL